MIDNIVRFQLEVMIVTLALARTKHNIAVLSTENDVAPLSLSQSHSSQNSINNIHVIADNEFDDDHHKKTNEKKEEENK